MALEFAHGAIQWNSADGVGTTYTVSGLSFQPKALRFYTQGLGSSTDTSSETVTARKCVGFATSTTNRRCVAASDVDGSGSMSCDCGLRADAVVATVTTTPAFDGLLDLNAINSDGFQLIVDDAAPVNLSVFWEAWGGADITVAQVDSIFEPAATGNVDYTVTGFMAGATDQVVMFAGIQSTASSNTAQSNDSGLYVGFASSGAAADNVVVVGNNDDGSPSADTDGYALDGECLAMITVAGGNPSARATLTQFGTDNFRLNWLARATTNRSSIFLAIKGGQWKAGGYTLDEGTVGNTATVSGLAFQPKGGCALGRLSPKDTAGTSTTEDKMSLGSWTSTSSRRAMGHRSENGTANAEIDLTIQYDAMLAFPSTAGALLAATDIDAVLSDGFRVIVDTAVSGTNWQGYLTFGDAAAAGTTVSVPVRSHSYTAQAPQVRARVQPAQVTHTYTSQAPKFVRTIRPAQVTHTYTGQSPQVRARVQPGQVTHSYTCQVPTMVGTLRPAQVTHSYTARVSQVQASVGAGAATHSYTGATPQVRASVGPGTAAHAYTGQIPGIGALISVTPPAATHNYTGQTSQLRARVQPVQVTHSYTGQMPTMVGTIRPSQATHTYTAQAPQVRAQVQPGAATHTYIGQSPQVRMRVQPGAATHTYTGQIPSIGALVSVTPPAATHSYTAGTPQLRARVQPAQATHSYTAQAPQAKVSVKPTQVMHTYTVPAAQARASVHSAQATHIYAGQTPQAKTQVQAAAATHTYTARAPNIVFGNTILIDVAAHTYLARAPKLQAQVRAAAVTHVYTSRTPQYVAQIAYTAEPLRARIGATPAVDTHTRIGATPAVDTHTRIGESPALDTHKRIGDPAK